MKRYIILLLLSFTLTSMHFSASANDAAFQIQTRWIDHDNNSSAKYPKARLLRVHPSRNGNEKDIMCEDESNNEAVLICYIKVCDNVSPLINTYRIEFEKPRAVIDGIASVKIKKCNVEENTVYANFIRSRLFSDSDNSKSKIRRTSYTLENDLYKLFGSQSIDEIHAYAKEIGPDEYARKLNEILEESSDINRSREIRYFLQDQSYIAQASGDKTLAAAFSKLATIQANVLTENISIKIKDAENQRQNKEIKNINNIIHNVETASRSTKSGKLTNVEFSLLEKAASDLIY